MPVQMQPALLDTPLTIAPVSERRLGELEATVKDGLKSFVAVGNALVELREGKGYKLRGYTTFETYCAKVFGFSDRHGRRMIAAAETAKAVELVAGSAPASESVAREFVSVADDPKKLEKVVATLEKRGYSVNTATAELVKQAVEKVTPPKRRDPAQATGAGTGKVVAIPSQTNGFPQTTGGRLPASAAYDLAFIARTLSDAHIWIKTKHGPSPLLADLEKAQAMLSGKTAPTKTSKQNGVPKCAKCKESITPGDPFCNNCGAVL